MRHHSCFLPKLDPTRLFFIQLLLVVIFLATGGAQAAESDYVPQPSGYVSQQSDYISQQPAEVGNLLREGRRLELQKRWGEALSHYEKAIRSFPDEVSLHHRYEKARLNHDVGRRYHDNSFCIAMGECTLERALDTYIEVTLKIHSHYVETPHWKELIECGLNGLDVALQSPAFLEENGLTSTPQSEISALRHELRRELGRRVISTHTEAREAVSYAAQTISDRLGVRPAAVVLEFCCAAVNTLDPYSSFLTPGQLSEVYSQIEGNFVGLGIELKTIGQRLTIIRVIPNSPAEEAGIKDGDTIIAVDGQSVETMSTDKAANLLQGVEGSEVRLTLLRPNQETYLTTATRRRVDVPSIEQVKIVDPKLGIGYLKLTCFQKSTARDLDAALWSLHRQGMRRGLIMDLRGNPGGLLVTAVEVVDKFVKQGTIVSTRGRNVREAFTYSAHADNTWGVPLVVLIDGDSASAAEIFAGAIRDHARGTIIGTKSYGKGSVQGIFPLHSSGAGMRLTTAKFYSPKNLPFSLRGVTPDIRVQESARPVNGTLVRGSEDATLRTALNWMQRPQTTTYGANANRRVQ